VEAERNQLLKDSVDAELKEKVLAAELEKCHEFMLRINVESFQHGVRKVAFFHGVPMDDPRYDLNKNVVDGKLVPVGRNADTIMEELEDRPNRIEATESEPSFEEIIEPLM